MPLLNWLTRDADLTASTKAPYRLLEHVPALSFGAADTENMLIQGDNLDALKALLPFYAGRVKCVYIDPPFNTENAFEHYDDNVEHSIWLGIMYPRLELLHELVAEAGSLWISIDDNELGYLIAIADEIFGRRNRIFVGTFKQSSASGPKAINPGVVTTSSYIVCYAKDKSKWQYSRVFTARERDTRYSKFIVNPDAPFDEWRLENLSDVFAKHLGVESVRDAKKKLADKYEADLHRFVITNANRVVRTARVAEKDVNESARSALRKSQEFSGMVFCSPRPGLDNQYFLDGEQLIFYRNKIRTIDGVETTAEPLTNLWTDLLSNNLHNEGGVGFPNGKKPEGLIKRILEISTQPGDFVLDSFLGSGTTAAVAHKMKRQYIGIEMRQQAETHCSVRLKNVIKGDQSGISKAVKWTGGGGYRFYRLGSAVFDTEGRINPGIPFTHLAAHIWFSETHTPLTAPPESPLLGVHNGIAYYLLFNGILGDKRPEGGNVLTSKVLAMLPPFDGPKVIYGESSRFGSERLQMEQITFKQTPYDIKAR